MALNVSATVSEIVTALEAIPKTGDINAYITAFITHLYVRIAADMQVNAGQTVATTGTATAQSGFTTTNGTVS